MQRDELRSVLSALNDRTITADPTELHDLLMRAVVGHLDALHLAEQTRTRTEIFVNRITELKDTWVHSTTWDDRPALVDRAFGRELEKVIKGASL